MPRVNVLSKELSELIAAGEVIERPSSVIKELLENSVDSGAKNITVEIKNGGVTFMRVTDDGCGFYREDIRNAFLRHATSKISTSDDLDSIGTLGFRGEALASICAVAKVDLLTKSPEEDFGSSYSIYPSGETDIVDAGCPNGTTIIVRDIFYNIPARMKFLKKDVAEGNSVAGVVEKIAISHPDISIKFIRDGALKIHTLGDGNLLSTIRSALGAELAQNMLPVDLKLGDVSVNGYITKPTYSQGSRRQQHFFVNGRYVKTKTAMAALEEGFKNSIMKGKYPGCVLNIDIPFHQVDVNVHPAKIEIRFVDEKPVFSAVYNAVEEAISSIDLTKPDGVSSVAKQLFKENEPFTPGKFTAEQLSLLNRPHKLEEETDTICYKRIPKSRNFFQSNVAKSYCETTGRSQFEDFFEVPVHNINISMYPAPIEGERKVNNIGLVPRDPSVLVHRNIEVVSSIDQDQIDKAKREHYFDDLTIPFEGKGETVPGEEEEKLEKERIAKEKEEKRLSEEIAESEKDWTQYLKQEPKRDGKISTDIYSKEFKDQCDDLPFIFDYGDEPEDENNKEEIDPDSLVNFADLPLEMIDIKDNSEDDDEHHFDMFLAYKKKVEEKAIAEESYKRFDGYKYVGELFKTYIMMEKDDTLILVDKHAAHERLLYNKFRTYYENANISTQMLLEPEIIPLMPDYFQCAMDNKEFLERFGYSFDDFGDRSIAVREIPMPFSIDDALTILDDMIGKLHDNNTVAVPDLVEDLLHFMSCRMAIRANDNNKTEELLEIIKQLDENPYVNFCPHGRPIMKAISKRSFSKLFKRT